MILTPEERSAEFTALQAEMTGIARTLASGGMGKSQREISLAICRRPTSGYVRIASKHGWRASP